MRITWLLFKLSFCALGNIFKSFNHSGALHYKYFIKFNAINQFNIGVNGHNTVIVPRCYWVGSSHSFQNISQQADRRGGKGPEKERAGPRSEFQWPCPCISAPFGDSSVWRAVFTLLLLVTFWCHGVMVKWLPSHVAARGGATSGTIRSPRVGARTQEAPAGCNALTLPPPWLPWNRELVEALLTTSQCLCVPSSSQGPRGPRARTDTYRHSNQEKGAPGVTGGNLHVLLWPGSHAEIKLCLSRETQCGRAAFIPGRAGAGQLMGRKPWCLRTAYLLTTWCSDLLNARLPVFPAEPLMLVCNRRDN